MTTIVLVTVKIIGYQLDIKIMHKINIKIIILNVHKKEDGNAWVIKVI